MIAADHLRMDDLGRYRCVVLGGGGFLGSHLCQRLSRGGASVVAFGRHCRFPELLEDVQWVEGDLRDTGSLAPLLVDADVVFHLICSSAPETSNYDMRLDIQENLESSVALFDLAAKARVRSIVFASSGGTVYGPTDQSLITENHPTNPISSYGIIKLSIEKYLALYERLHGIRCMSLRIANPFGPGQLANKRQGVIAAFAERALLGEPIEIWGDGSAQRDFIYVSDVVEAFLRAMAYTEKHRVFNVGSGVGTSIIEIAAAVEKALLRPIQVVHRPGRPVDADRVVLATGRIERETGWRPSVDFAIGLQSTIQWLSDRLR